MGPQNLGNPATAGFEELFSQHARIKSVQIPRQILPGSPWPPACT